MLCIPTLRHAGSLDWYDYVINALEFCVLLSVIEIFANFSLNV
jgi:hypothetical protein